MQPRDQEPAQSRKESNPNLDIPEPALTAMLEKYCDLRRRGFSQQAIQNKASWPRNHQKLLLEEAQRREMAGSQQSQQQAVTEWLLATFDAGTELKVIQRASAFTGQQTNKWLQAALDATSRPAPTGLIIMDIQGEPARVSWLDTNGELMHRPFDGAFPADYTAELAVQQCSEVASRLMSYPNSSARDRAYTMLLMAEAGLHSFNYDSGRRVHAELDTAGLDNDAKHAFILKLHPNEDVGRLLLKRCGISSKWLTGNRARTLSRLMRHHEFPPAVTRHLLEHLGNNPDTYYIIGADYRIPEPSEAEKAQCIQALQQAGFSDETIEIALATLGVPPSGHHPPKQGEKGFLNQRSWPSTGENY